MTLYLHYLFYFICVQVIQAHTSYVKYARVYICSLYAYVHDMCMSVY